MLEFISENLAALWLVIAVVCLIIELCSGGFFIICFSFGALFGALASLFGGFYAQLGAFIIFTAIGILLVRPVAMKYFHRNSNARPSNVDALIGRTGKVTQTITKGGYGRVAIDGDDWKARADNAQDEITEGATVKVISQDSVIITVTKNG